MQVFLQGLNKQQIERYQKLSKSHEYEEVAKKVLSTGGTKTKSVKEISETSKVIKEKMDQDLKQILLSYDLKSEFFITSPSLKKLWHAHFSNQYRVPLDLFLQSFEYSYGKDILAGERLEHFKWLFNVQREDSSDMQSYTLGLDGLVNLTDQIQFSTLIRMFEVDQFD